ncbi:translocation/assembly module TamB domain-containing protein [Undibacterium arcticum]
MNGSANMPSLAWLAPLAGQPGLELDGKLALSLAASGTVAAPKLRGELRGEQLALRWIDQGLKLRNGSLLAQLSGDQLQLQTLRFDGEQGSAHADGFMRFADADVSMQIKLSADQLQVLSRPDRLLVVSGQSNLALKGKRLRLDGKFRAERAMIELQSQDAPVISDDVVVLGPAGKPGARAAARQQTGFPLDLDIEADLGDRFYLKGQGLDAQLAGTVRIRSTDKRLPRATGSIRVVEGTYVAYGQKLAIERGIINFSGAFDNPGINILAVRKIADPEKWCRSRGRGAWHRAGAEGKAGLDAGGAGQRKKLSWLVLGHGSEGGGSRDRQVLAAAAGALFGGGQSRLANSLGLDELGMARAQGQAQGLESTVLTLGKRISSRVYLSYEQGVSGATSLVKLRYMLSKRFFRCRRKPAPRVRSICFIRGRLIEAIWAEIGPGRTPKSEQADRRRELDVN